jgi:peptidoglycan hydrolase CwlO-like protein
MKIKIIYGLLTFLMFYTLGPFSLSLAEEVKPSAETKELLQKGLTIYEIDRELARLNERDGKIANQIQSTGLDIEKQDKKVKAARKHAAQVLRAYYTGERDSIWLLLFSMKSFTDVLQTFEYLNMIVQNDHRALSTFTTSFHQLGELKTQLVASRSELQKTKENYLQQRSRLVQLQTELDQQLAISAQASVVKDQIRNFNETWEQKGIPTFRQFFEELSKALVDLPQILTKDSGKNLIFNGTTGATFTLTDENLNQFLQSKNTLFSNMQFRFTDGKVVITGKKDDLNAVIKGNFKLLDGKENKIKFTVDQLVFNDYQLPDTTIASFMNDFNLDFSPQKIAPIEVTGLSEEEGKLLVLIKFSF